MKLQKKDTVMVISGKYKSKKGEVMTVLPKTNQVVVEGVNIVKRHTKPTQANPKGGILDMIKPISASKVMVLDPKTGRPARIGYVVKNGKKERVFKVSSFQNAKPKKTTKKATEAKK